MKKFIKAIIYIFGILLAIELSITYYISGMVEQKFKEMENLLNDNQLVSSEVVSYNKGLFKSEAITTIRFKGLDLEKPIQVKHTIFNGPIIFDDIQKKPIKFELAFIKSIPIEIPSEFQIQFITNTTINYSGDIENSTNGSLYKIQNQQFQVTGSGWSSKNTIKKDMQDFKGSIIIQDPTIQWMGMNLVIKGIEVRFDQKRSSFGTWLGNLSFLLNNAIQKEQNFELNNLKLEESSILRGPLIDIFWKMEFSKANFLNNAYGQTSFNVQVMNIDPNGLRRLSEIDTDKTEDSILNAFRSLLVKRPKIIVENSVLSLPQGDLHIHAELSVGGPDITIPLSKEVLEKTLDGNLLLVMPKKVFKQGLAIMLKPKIEKDAEYQKMNDAQKKQNLDQQIDLKINKLKKDNILSETEKNYEIKISIVQGKWVAKS